MAKIKLTKSELKSQRDNLKQFSRFLPTLLLKKQQLQMEMRRCKQDMDRIREREKKLKENILSWISLFGDDDVIPFLQESVKLKEIEKQRSNIAGVDVPVFVSAKFAIADYSLFTEAPWIDNAIAILKDILSCKAEHDIVAEQYKLIGNELRVTTQRVNLFEKVKIPECSENIRVIKIYLGDQQTAAVGRSKIAKRKMQKILEMEKNAA
jgi:V/A-type H+/Na+-transporting ATPase subunit D